MTRLSLSGVRRQTTASSTNYSPGSLHPSSLLLPFSRRRYYPGTCFLNKTMLQYPDLAKLQTRKIVFEDVVAARDSATLEHLKELSSKRRVIEESINQTSSITEAIAREMSGGLTSRVEQVISSAIKLSPANESPHWWLPSLPLSCLLERLRLEQYLPLLENFIYHIDLVSSNGTTTKWISELKITWSSVLSSSLFSILGPKYFQIDNIGFELCMALFLYGAVLRDIALELLQTDLKNSAFTFRQAAGVFRYLADVVIPSLQPAIVTSPPEANSSVCNAISFICLAEAQSIYIRRAEETGSTSSGVLAKLHQGASEFFGEAIVALHTGMGDCKGICSRFMELIHSSKALHELQSRKYLAQGLKDNEQLGVAIGVLRNSLGEARKKMAGDVAWRAVFSKEVEIADNMLRKFEHENEFVWHDKIPCAGEELPLPEGSKLVKPQPYEPKRFEVRLDLKV